ncbi:MAG TPA: acetyltransferase [Phycisphaerales bacterium]|nr:acetyltransferase [Phycisphaerales bacterium]
MSAQSGVRTLVLVGGGGHAAVVADAARTSGWTVLGYMDDSEAGEAMARIAGMKRLGAVAELERVLSEHAGASAHAAVGDNDVRRKFAERAGAKIAEPIVHPAAVVSDSASLSRGSFVGATAVVQARAVIGRGVIINTGAIIEHDCRIGDWSHIAPSAVLTGGVVVGAGAMVGTGARVIPQKSIGERAIVGAGACVIDDVPSHATVVGVPARIVV